jgi:AcrR family transcriptional regulator
MRYPSDHKARARRTLLEAGTRSLKSSGFNGIGVDGLAAAAGVTSGAFYSNFANKEAMLEAVIDAGLGEPFLSDTDSATQAEGRARLLGFLREYISTDHSLDAAEGCVMPALSADVSRAEPPVKDAYQRKMTALIDRIAGMLDGDASDRQRRAWSIVALMVGSIVISRGMPEQSQSRTAQLDSALSTASMLVDADDGAHHTSD